MTGISSTEAKPAIKQISSLKIHLEKDLIVSAMNTCSSLSPPSEDLSPSPLTRQKYLLSEKKIQLSRIYASLATKAI